MVNERPRLMRRVKFGCGGFILLIFGLGALGAYMDNGQSSTPPTVPSNVAHVATKPADVLKKAAEERTPARLGNYEAAGDILAAHRSGFEACILSTSSSVICHRPAGLLGVDGLDARIDLRGDRYEAVIFTGPDAQLEQLVRRLTDQGWTSDGRSEPTFRRPGEAVLFGYVPFSTVATPRTLTMRPAR